jgi:fluoroacetyl-CoA thioesterase
MGVLDNVTLDMMAEQIVTVTSEMTVGHFVAQMPQVYATPMMILHMEMASGSAIASHLPEGFVSVGGRKIGDGTHRRGIVNVLEFEKRYGVRQLAMNSN